MTYYKTMDNQIFNYNKNINNPFVEFEKNDTLNDINNLNKQYTIIDNGQIKNVHKNKMYSYNVKEEKMNFNHKNNSDNEMNDNKNDNIFNNNNFINTLTNSFHKRNLEYININIGNNHKKDMNNKNQDSNDNDNNVLIKQKRWNKGNLLY